jgi:uncharacterized protein YegP (UPF0339 family)
MRFEIYRDADNQYRFRLVAANNKIICSSEAYRNRKDCLDAIELVRDSQHSPIRFKRKVRE